MENNEDASSKTKADMKREAIPSTGGSRTVASNAAALTKPDAEDEIELQYLDQSGKINLSNSKKKSFFQITSVTENVNDENDSMDELDESRVDDMSSADLSKISVQTDADTSDADPELSRSATVVSVNSNSNSNSNSAVVNPEANGNGPSRFKLVKVARVEPIKRGRWTCKDIPIEPQPGTESITSKIEQLKDNVSGSSSAASSVHYVPGENPPTENPLGEGNSTSQTTAAGIEKSSKDAKSSSHKKDGQLSAENIDNNKRDSKYLKLESSDLPSLKDSLNVDMNADSQSEGDDSTSATGGAIDNKIEQAMDLVKSHLLFAVREEVEVLKEQIKELLDKNENLQRENTALRQNQSQGLPPQQQQQQQQQQHLPYTPAETPQASRDPGFHTAAAAVAAGQRADGFPQQQLPTATEQFTTMQGVGGPTHGQAAPQQQQQALPQQQANQYAHIQQASSLQQQQQQHNQPQT